MPPDKQTAAQPLPGPAAADLLSLSCLEKPETHNAGRASRQGVRDLNREASIQAAIVEWCRLVAPHLIVFHVANGGLRSKAEAARLKWQGVMPGVFDLCLVLHDGTAFIEVKTETGSLSPSQKEFRSHLISMNVPTFSNPKGCWNWWGYAGDNYFPTKKGVQIDAIWKMIQRIDGK